MAIVPHPPIFLAEIRTTDIWFLLGVGALYELLTRSFLLAVKRKPQSLLEKEAALQALQTETDIKRKMGPSAFVETSKLERQVLAMEKELEKLNAERKASCKKVEKIFFQSGNMQLALLFYILYFGVPLITIQGLEVGLGDTIEAGDYLRTILFPVSYIGVGIRLSKWGLPAEIAASSFSGLVVFWSAQVTVGKLMDAAEAYVLQ